jgi:hypothetical protein
MVAIMSKNAMIKTFLIEEHHEAFLVWKYAILNNWMPARGNSLLHIDEHSDMGTPRFNTSIYNLNGDTNVIKNFVYTELNIASFIMPAIYQDIFDKVYWIKQQHRLTSSHSNDAVKKTLCLLYHCSHTRARSTAFFQLP